MLKIYSMLDDKWICRFRTILWPSTAIFLLGFLGMACGEGQRSLPETPQHTGEPQGVEKALPDTTEVDPYRYAKIGTPLGNIVIRLYNETVKHRDNFIKLTESGFYDGLYFHRVMRGLMIQGGDPNTKNVNPADDGLGGPGYVIDSEILPYSYHKRGEVCAIQSVEVPGKSSGSQFYIVQGGDAIPEIILKDQEQQVREQTGIKTFHYSQEARQHYLREGGAPWLDLQYTCFGEVVSGLDALDRLAHLETPRTTNEILNEPSLLDRPKQIQKAKMTIKMLEQPPKLPQRTNKKARPN